MFVKILNLKFFRLDPGIYKTLTELSRSYDPPNFIFFKFAMHVA